MNPFLVPKRVFVKASPQDMRAGIERLAAVVASEFDADARDGSVYAFVSKDRKKVKMVAFEGSQACLWYVRAFRGHFPIAFGEGLCEVDAARLLIFLKGAEPVGSPRRYSVDLR